MDGNGWKKLFNEPFVQLLQTRFEYWINSEKDSFSKRSLWVMWSYIYLHFPDANEKWRLKEIPFPPEKKKWGNPGPGVSMLLKLGAVHPSQRINHCSWSHINPYKRPPVFKKYCYNESIKQSPMCLSQRSLPCGRLRWQCKSPPFQQEEISWNIYKFHHHITDDQGGVMCKLFVYSVFFHVSPTKLSVLTICLLASTSHPSSSW